MRSIALGSVWWGWPLLATLGCGDPLATGSFRPSGECESTTVLADVEPLFVEYGADWNDYVARDETLGRLEQEDLPCSGSEPGGYAACWHGGELRRIALPDRAECGTLHAEDDLQAFAWACDDSRGTVVFYSHGLRPGRGLADLLTTDGFLPNRVTIFDDSCEVARSTRSIWWSNPVSAVDADPGVSISLDAEGTIYVVSRNRATAGIGMAADRIALVTLGDAVLSRSPSAAARCLSASGELSDSGTTRSVVCAGAQRFVWLEAQIDGTQSDNVLLRDLAFSRLHRLRVWGHEGSNIDIHQSRALLASDCEASRGGQFGVRLLESTHVTLLRGRFSVNREGVFVASGSDNATLLMTTADNNEDAGIHVLSGDDSLLVGAVATANGEDGVLIEAAARATIAFATLANNGRHGLFLDTTRYTTATQLVAVANGTSGVTLYDDSSHNTFRAIGAASNLGSGLAILGSSDNTFAGDMLLGTNAGGDCTLDASSSGSNEIDASCHFGPSLSLLPTLVDASASFVGRVATDDAVNRDDGNGLASYATLTDWSEFEASFRAWGRSGEASFPDMTLAGPCGPSSTCQIWDWRLAGSDTAFLRRNGVLAPGSPCPAQVAGTEATTSQANPVEVYLTHAMEIIGDARGDDDGLCESHEACTFAPNIGAYQGHGDAGPEACEFADGVVMDVSIVELETVGVD